MRSGLLKHHLEECVGEKPCVGDQLEAAEKTCLAGLGSTRQVGRSGAWKFVHERQQIRAGGKVRAEMTE